ncbi:phosphatidylserine decarboxylase [Colletotrichum graminicola]|uniref:Phosphatidylserine decarboxylase proenzyme 1, mitochondrial n=1 Tax=Colletotrichum graminicola (strain M1.001 / M2 / FGSC 10212) TaxID=645133 RepID=E3Q4T3_COLGM|nr:phosphatidylserine decarboxylase [Colletotrichum graminicola M1.001]EFQ26098.1 phosphatidylserine decarboxylase [Colletotrichum graminicola M1.001]WDK23260.1 phosphatidylserine decarboxylase [Colletotrichum graminicola]
MATLYARQSQLRAAKFFSIPGPFASTRFFSQQQQRPRFSSRLRHALKNSKVQWYQIPVGVGIGFLGLVQFYKVSSREREKEERGEVQDGAPPPKKRAKIRPDGPWQVQVMSTLPLKAISRLWGRFNELTIPYYLRVPGFKLYSWIFGVNLSEVAEPDLHTYPNLASFFYRELKPGARPLDPNSNALLSPSDGRVLQYGQIQGGDIEQVKGMTYSIDALLGKNTPTPSISSGWSTPQEVEAENSNSVSPSQDLVKTDEEFARVNGISYTVPSLLSGAAMSQRRGSLKDEAGEHPSASAVSEVRADLALGEKPWYDLISPDNKTALYYAVIYLAPGDYHRFHSPANWVVERRRHFAGELFSVSPYLQRTLPGLFTLNERVVLLGRWRYGFFSYVPVGATNVGSIKINFDRELRTNSLTTDTAADRAAEEAANRGEPYTGFSEATYASASPVLGGHALRRGEEMGGFQLGSTIVLVFEAPTEGKTPEDKKGWRWAVEKGQTVRMGQALGYVEEE